MTIRYAQAGDSPAVMALWEACFPGEDLFTAYFFKALYDPSHALLCEAGHGHGQAQDHGQVVAMLHMMPYTFTWLGRDMPLSYIYGVGTHPDFRRRGLAGDLLDQALFEMHLRGVAFAALIPQQQWLFAYYRSFGFAPVFTQPPLAYDFSGTPQPADEGHIPLLDALYETSLAGRPHVRRTPEHWRGALRECALGGGRILLDGALGYAVFPRGDDAPPMECFGPGAREDGPERPTGCLRVVNAALVSGVARQNALRIPPRKLDDPHAPWNSGNTPPRTPGPSHDPGHDPDHDPGPAFEDTLDIASFTELLFSDGAPYMQLMHN